jgi:sec-independent protein translocase protein TatA
MLGGIGIPELAIVLVIILVIFGAGKLPEIGGGMGNAILNFKKSVHEEEDPKNVNYSHEPYSE